jgi:YVTN family beta-propeller protein
MSIPWRSAVFTLAVLAVSLAHAATQDRLYVPLGGANAIAIIDPATDAIVGRIEGVPAVHGLAATPDARLLVAGSFSEQPAGAPPPKPAGMSADDHAAHHRAPPGGAAATPAAVSVVSIVSTASNEVIRRIDVPGAVHHVAVSPDGRTAVVTHPGTGTVSIIDLATYRLAGTVATGPLPNYAVYAPDGKRLYVSNAGNGTVSDVDTSRWVVLRNILVGESPEHMALSHDGATLYVANVKDGSVSVVGLDRGEVRETLKTGAALHGVDLSDDDDTLYVSVIGGNRVVAFDLAGGGSKPIDLAPAPYHLAVVRGGSKLYVASASEPKIWVVRTPRLDVIGEILVGAKAHQMVQLTLP